MIRTLWYLVKIILLLGVATYLATLPGALQLSWADYHVTVQMGFLAVSAFGLFLAMVYVSGLAYRVVSFPKAYRQYRQQKRYQQGYRALLQSLTAAATGDQKHARYLAYRAQKYLPETESGLPLLLQAQALREINKGDLSDPQALDKPYAMLLQNAETALLGLQGLVQNAILAGDFEKALVLARDAARKYPKNYALLKTVYDLEIKNRLWNDALVTLDLAVKHKVMDKGASFHDKAALYCVLGDMARDGGRMDEALASYKKAASAEKNFVPAIVRLADGYLQIDQRKKALSVVEKCWKETGHPDLIPVWRRLKPAPKSGQLAPTYKWFEYVLAYHPASYEGLLALAEAAIEDGLWGDARAALAKAEKIAPSDALYKLWVKIEEKTTNRSDVIRQWLDRAYSAPKLPRWVCEETGRSFDVWQAVIEPHGPFNSLVWRVEDLSGKANEKVKLIA